MSDLTLERLRCEYLQNPLGIDALQPRLSWVLKSDARGEKQTAYQVLVASSLENLARDNGDLWDSGVVPSDSSIQVEYAGADLSSRQSCVWKVRVWDKDGQPSHWSEAAYWTMGLLNPSDWQASWIGVDEPEAPEYATPRYLRHHFTLDKPIECAKVYTTALGLYELRLNGQRVGDHLLAPEWTNYFKRVQYQTYDVTDLLKTGENAIGAMLGNGWYCGGWQHWQPKLKPLYGTQPYLLTQLEIEFTDGTRQSIISDGSWHGTTQGPLRFAGIYEGETYDARKEFAGWDRAAFDDKDWLPATIALPQLGALVSQRSEPIRATQEIKPISITQPKPDVWVFDLGQNIAGWCRLNVNEPAGTLLTLEHNEVLNPDGTVYMDNLHAGHHSSGDRQVVRYISNGVQAIYEPHFTYQGFRYVQVTGLTQPPAPDFLTGIVFHTSFEKTGEFTCSNPLINKLVENIQWSQRGNMMGVPTDCPQRDERCGYTGDAVFFIETALYNFDQAAFFNKWLVDVCQDAQLPDGHFGDFAPTYHPGDGWNVGWSDGGIICTYWIYRAYGDTRIIREHYDAMKRKLALLEANTNNDVFSPERVGNGDWLNLGGGASKDVIGSAFCAYDFALMAEMAEAIGEKADATKFGQRAEELRAGFAREFIDEQGHIKDSSQTGYALAYTMGLVPPDKVELVSERFAEEITRFDDHLATGFIGTPRLLLGLHLAGRDDLAYKLLLNQTFPSWLYPVTLGATTMWERWDGWRPETGFADSGMNSFNHYSFGAVGHYLFGMVGGISATSAGYKTIKIQPVIQQGLTWANTSFESPYGTIVSNWEVEDGNLTMAVTIPPNTTATIYVPSQPTTVHEVGAGSYRFAAQLV